MVALLTLLSEAVRVQSSVSCHGSCLCKSVPVLCNPSWFLVMSVRVSLVWVLQIRVTRQIVQQVVFCLLVSSGGSVLSILFGRYLWVKKLYFTIVWLEEDGVLQVRAHIHRCLVAGSLMMCFLGVVLNVMLIIVVSINMVPIEVVLTDMMLLKVCNLIVRLQEKWVLQIGSHIHGGLIAVQRVVPVATWFIGALIIGASERHTMMPLFWLLGLFLL